MKKWVLAVGCMLMILITTDVFATPEMVLVKAGTFQMGNTIGDIEGLDNEKPVHTVRLTYDFYIGKYEVTFNEYDAYCEETGKSKKRDRGWERGERPIIYVNWSEAVAYCNWLSEKEGLAKAYDSEGNLLDRNGKQTTDITKVQGYRLPTEAEWEYAARGGHKSTEDFKYAGSNTFENVAWCKTKFREDTVESTYEVGQKAPNELGLYDMSGNVWEWCHDYWDSNYYAQGDKTNPTGPESPTSKTGYRVARGGAWYFAYVDSRVANRSDCHPNLSSYSNGMRLARTSD